MNERGPRDCGSGCRGFDPRHSPNKPQEVAGRKRPQLPPVTSGSTRYSSDSVQELAEAPADLVVRLLPIEEWDGAGRVYFIECEREFVKIGFSNRLAARFAELRAANPHALRIAGVLAGSVEFERELHARFAPLRHQREWFKRRGDLAALLDCEEAVASKTHITRRDRRAFVAARVPGAA